VPDDVVLVGPLLEAFIVGRIMLVADLLHQFIVSTCLTKSS
jgi:hypothetical protein